MGKGDAYGQKGANPSGVGSFALPSSLLVNAILICFIGGNKDSKPKFFCAKAHSQRILSFLSQAAHHIADM